MLICPEADQSEAPFPAPELTGDGSRTFFSPRYQQTYHSQFGAVTESRVVFLQNSGIAARLAAHQPATVLELGFGLGLNFLLTADLALMHHCPLSYTAFEHDLVSAEQFGALDYGPLLQHSALSRSLRPVFNQNSANAAGNSISHSTHLADYCQLSLHRTDCSHACFGSTAHFDAIYLDAFSPDSNPECWTGDLFQRLRRVVKPGGILATYSVKGAVRRALDEAGFETRKLAGPPGKREILSAIAN